MQRRGICRDEIDLEAAERHLAGRARLIKAPELTYRDTAKSGRQRR